MKNFVNIALKTALSLFFALLLPLLFVSTTLVPALSYAQVTSATPTLFTEDLSVGATDTAAVLALQQFLVSQGFLSVTPTGYFGSLTEAAVVAFQSAHSVPATGYFGPLSQAAANVILVMTPGINAGINAGASATITAGSVSDTNTLSAAVIAVKQKSITWQTTGYPSGAGVTINLIRKVSTSPASYTFVRVIAQNAPNTGSYLWTPLSTDTTTDLYVEISCSKSYTYKGGCHVLTTPLKVN